MTANDLLKELQDCKVAAGAGRSKTRHLALVPLSFLWPSVMICSLSLSTASRRHVSNRSAFCGVLHP